MRSLALLVALLAPLTAHSQVCNPVCATQPSSCCAVPQGSPFMAYESASRSSGIFRGVGSQTPGDCTVTTDIDPVPPVDMPLPPAPVTVNLPGGGTLSFKLQQLVEEWDTTGGPLGGGDCFTLRTKGFHTPPGPFMVTDGCGTHLITIDQPTFFCVTPTIRVICFESKNLNSPPLPLPPGFDRAEDVCIAF